MGGVNTNGVLNTVVPAEIAGNFHSRIWARMHWLRPEEFTAWQDLESVAEYVATLSAGLKVFGDDAVQCVMDPKEI